jgi:hypothetical protein
VELYPTYCTAHMTLTLPCFHSCNFHASANCGCADASAPTAPSMQPCGSASPCAGQFHGQQLRWSKCNAINGYNNLVPACCFPGTYQAVESKAACLPPLANSPRCTTCKAPDCRARLQDVPSCRLLTQAGVHGTVRIIKQGCHAACCEVCERARVLDVCASVAALHHQELQASALCTVL